MDGDGDLDPFIGALEYDPPQLFRNNGDRTFTNVAASSGVDTIASRYTVSAAFGDYDLDGDLDMFLTHWGTPRDPGAYARRSRIQFLARANPGSGPDRNVVSV